MHEAVKQSLIGNEPSEKKENPLELARQIHFYTRTQHSAKDRHERLLDLMQRRSAKKWIPKKKQKMVRRLQSTSQILEQCDSALDQLTTRLQQLMQEAQTARQAVEAGLKLIAEPPTTTG